MRFSKRSKNWHVSYLRSVRKRESIKSVRFGKRNNKLVFQTRFNQIKALNLQRIGERAEKIGTNLRFNSALKLTLQEAKKSVQTFGLILP